MDAREFLSRVIAWDVVGYTSLHLHRPGNPFSGRSCVTLDKAIEIIGEFSTVKENLYFCVSRQIRGGGHRARDTAVALKCLFFDIDVEPGNPAKYQSTEEALFHLYEFCKAIGIPNPSIVVSSGSGGLHTYWISDRSLTLTEWLAYATAFKRVAKDYGLKFDQAVPADAARVLRVPDTWNYKYDPPRWVRVMGRFSFGVAYDFAATFTFANIGFGTVGVDVAPGPAFACVEPGPTFVRIEESNANQSNPTPGKFLETPSRFDELDPDEGDLGEGIEELPPLPLAPILANCEWLRVAHETGGREYDNPQWHLTALAATFLEDGHDLAHKLGNLHPTYSYRETEELWQRKNRERHDKDVGWPSCQAIADSGSRYCEACPAFQKGKSPLHFGLDAIRTQAFEGNEDVGQSNGLRLPKDYITNKEGFICRLLPAKKLKNGITLPRRSVQVLYTKIYDPSPQKEGGVYGLGFTADVDKNTPKQIFIPSKNITGAAFLQQLNEECVLFNADSSDLLKNLGPSWLAKLKAEEQSREMGTLCWRYEDGKRAGFSYGGLLFRLDGSTEKSRVPISDNLHRWYLPTGRKGAWLRAAKLLTDRRRPELDIIIAVAFAAPLMTFGGTLYGGILSVWGTPGSAKSTAQQVAAAVWGHPKQTRESLDSTKKSVLVRLGKTKNLPAYWDDIQDEGKQEHLFNTMFISTEGTEGGRLTSDVRYRERLDWQTLMVACSNASFTEYVMRKQPSTTAGLRRVIEFEYNKPEDERGMIDELEANQAFAELEHNYGQIGVDYAKMLAFDHAKVEALTQDTIRRFKTAVKGKADEAYWWGIAGVLIAGATLARELGAELRPDAMEEFLTHAFQKNREIRSGEGTEGGSLENTRAALSLFLKQYVGGGHAIFTDKTSTGGLRVEPFHYPLPGKPINVHVIRDERTIRISKKILRKFLQLENIQTRQVLDGLRTYFKAKNVRLSLGAGTGYTVMQEDCIEIPVPTGSPLEELLNAHGQTQCDDWQGGGDE